MTPTFQPLGDCAVRMVFGEEMRLSISRRIQNFCSALEQNPVYGVTEWVPAYVTVTVYYRPWAISYEALCRELSGRARQRAGGGRPVSKVVEIPVRYGGDWGPDLETVALAHGLTAAQVIRRHARRRYQVYLLGFLPGFAYMGQVSEKIATSRRVTPRANVRAGSVGIAGNQTGIYPCASPGGWQILGWTPLTLYDPAREKPALLAVGDVVQFVPMDAD